MKRKTLRRGLVLILVLIVVAMLSLGAYSFTDLMLAHHDAALVSGKQVQARAAVDSGVEAVRVFLAQPPPDRDSAGGIFDNPGRFRGIGVVASDDPSDSSSFSVLAPSLDSYGNLGGVRNGLEDESTRLNLNTLLIADQTVPDGGMQLLMALPGMTEDVADAILDWLDADDEPRPYGAETSEYSGMSPPYAAKNGPIETVEELLLVRGVTPQLLFGADINRNGQLDPHETEGGSGGSTDPAAFRGWSAYLTLHSMEWNVTPEGQPRIYLNNNDLNVLNEQLSAVFPPEWVTFIIAYRQNGPNNQRGSSRSGDSGDEGDDEGESGRGGDGGGQSRDNQSGGEQSGGGESGGGESGGSSSDEAEQNVVGTLDLTRPAKTPIAQVLDLVGATVRYQFVGESGTTTIASPFAEDIAAMHTYLPLLMDHVTVNPATTIPGRINVNQAPQVVLLGIPGMSPDVVELILSARDLETTAENDARRHETWLLQEGLVTLDEMKQMMPFVNCGGDVYRAQVVGYFQRGSAASRAEVIFDATRPLARVLFWRDISHLGRGYALETLGVDFVE